jgi:hypothetical protein
MQLRSHKGVLSSLTKSINATSSAAAAATSSSSSSTVTLPTILTRIERTSSGRFVVKKANSIDDECSSEAISSCSDNDDKLFASKCHGDIVASGGHSSMHYDGDEEEEDEDDESSDDSDLMPDTFDVTLVDDDNYESPKNDAERMFLEVMEVLRFEQEVSARKYGRKKETLRLSAATCEVALNIAGA